MVEGVRPPWTVYLGFALIMALVVASYSNAVSTPFHLDDYHSIVFNQNIKDLGNLPLFFTTVSMTTHELKGGYRPIVTTSLALNYRIGELEPRGYHIFNIAAHLAVVTVFFLIALFFAQKTGQSAFVALLVTGMYALHPVHTNAVSYVIARSAIICAFFYLLSFYSYARYRDSDGKAWLAASMVSFLAAILTKETAVTLPIVLFLYELAVLKEKRLKEYALPAGFLGASVVYTLARFYSLTSLGQTVSAHAGSLMAQPRVLVDYLRLFALPFNLNFLPYVAIPHSAADPAFIIPMILISVVVLFIAVNIKKRGLAAFCIAWFFVALLPETFSNLQDLMIEYRLYLPSVGLLLAVVPASAALSGQRSRRMAAGLMAVAILLFPFLIHERNKVYSDDVVLWEDVVDKSPLYGEAYAFLGASYLNAGRNREAADALKKAFSLDPGLHNADYYNNLGTAEDLCGDYAGAQAAYRKALEINPEDYRTLRNAGILMLKTNRREEAVEYFKRASALHPEDAVMKTLIIQAGGTP